MSLRTCFVAAILVGASSAGAEDAAAGKALYAEHCVICHGLKGKGNGPYGKALDPKPTDFTTATPKDDDWFKATKAGSLAIGKSKNMEGFASKMTDAQIHDVLAYCKSLKKP